MKKPLFPMLLIACLTLALCSGLIISPAKANQEVSGVIPSDQTWTSTGGPYSLTGNVLVDSGITVTIQQDTTVNLNGYYIRVNGTLNIQPGVTLNMGVTGSNVGNIQVNGIMSARGTSTHPIYFNGASYSWDSLFVPPSLSYISFTALGRAWNDTASTSIIEYAVMNQTSVTTSVSITFSNNQLNGGGIGIMAGSPIISNNKILNSISVSGGSPVIANNQVNYIWVDDGSSAGSPTITSNVISNVNPQWPYATSAGIAVLADTYSNGLVLIEKNVIKSSATGIDLINHESQTINKPITIRYNTLINNDIGIAIAGKISPTITNNNIYSNTTSLKLSPESRDVTAAYNYWGTTDTSTIDRLIYDYNDDFNLGKVTYAPILTSPDASAPDPNQPIPDAIVATPTPALTATPSIQPPIIPTTLPTLPLQNPTAIPSQSGIQTGVLLSLDLSQIAIAVLLSLIVVLLIINIFYMRRRSQNRVTA